MHKIIKGYMKNFSSYKEGFLSKNDYVALTNDKNVHQNFRQESSILKLFLYLLVIPLHYAYFPSQVSFLATIVSLLN